MPTEPQSQPLVSIIVPVYNAADHIARCIESIRRQTSRNLEIILLNDGSKDVSYAVCQSYAGIDRRIVVIDKNNSGVSATRNLGMQEAHGKYFQFVDADDFIQPYATELLVQKAEASHADMVIAHYNRIEPPVSLPKTMRDTVVERVLDPILDPQHRVQTFGFLMEGPLNKDAFACGLMQEPASFYYGVMWNKLYRADIVREHPDEVKENIKKKFQDAKLPLVDEVINLDAEYRAAIGEGDTLRANRNKLSKQIGMLMGQAKKDPSKAAEAEEIKKQVTAQADRLKELETKEAELQDKIRDIMYTIPQMIDPSVPIGPDDSCNVEVQRFGEPVVPDYPIPYHVDIMESFDGIDLDAAGRVSGNGFYYLLGDIARLHEAVLAYARDFMINKGFTYVIPPFMMHGDVVKGVMSFPEMDAMMYKIEGEDLYLIGTSEHTMIGRFIDQTIDGEKLPLTLTSYSPCFRKEKGAHGIEERGIYRIHQFEKQEMIVVCKPEDSMTWYDKLWKNSVELFRSMEIPVRQLECCSGDLADLKVKSCDIEAWSPRQQKYFEVCSCSNLGDAQSRRLKIRIKGEDGKNYLPHTLNNTCVAPPRMLIAFLENNLRADGSVRIPEVLRPYMGGKAELQKA